MRTFLAVLALVAACEAPDLPREPSPGLPDFPRTAAQCCECVWQRCLFGIDLIPGRGLGAVGAYAHERFSETCVDMRDDFDGELFESTCIDRQCRPASCDPADARGWEP